MKRILVIGVCGAGKSTLARALSERTGLPLFPIDQLYWKPGWVESEKSEFQEKLENIVSGDQWIIDGNYSSTFHIRFPKADTIIYLDFPRRIAIYRAVKRIALSLGKTRQDMTPGCPERFDWEFIKYIWNFPTQHAPRAETFLSQIRSDQRVYRFARPKDAAIFLRNL